MKVMFKFKWAANSSLFEAICLDCFGHLMLMGIALNFLNINAL